MVVVDNASCAPDVCQLPRENGEHLSQIRSLKPVFSSSAWSLVQRAAWRVAVCIGQ